MKNVDTSVVSLLIFGFGTFDGPETDGVAVGARSDDETEGLYTII